MPGCYLTSGVNYQDGAVGILCYLLNLDFGCPGTEVERVSMRLPDLPASTLEI